jgi:hypothetical protein
LFKEKSIYDLKFKKLDVGSNKLTITDDSINDVVKLNIDDTKLVISPTQITNLDTTIAGNSTVVDLLSKKHEHNNKLVIDGLSDTGGVLQYNGSPIDKSSILINDLANGTTTTYSSDKINALNSGKSNVGHTHLATDIQTNSIAQFMTTSEQSAYNDAVAKKHEHTNKSVLDKITDISGKPYYDGNMLGDMNRLVFDVDNDGIIDKAKTLNGLNSTITELNYLQGATSNIQSQINAMSKGVHYGGTVATKADLIAKSLMTDGELVIVLNDETHSNGRSQYIYNGTSRIWEYNGTFDSTARDFKTDPLSLFNEVTGILAGTKIDNTIARVADLHSHANSSILNGLSDVGGDLYYLGKNLDSIALINDTTISTESVFSSNEVDARLGQKAQLTHNHNVTDINETTSKKFISVAQETDWNSAFAKSHEHGNTSVLTALADNNGKLNYNGNPVFSANMVINDTTIDANMAWSSYKSSIEAGRIGATQVINAQLRTNKVPTYDELLDKFVYKHPSIFAWRQSYEYEPMNFVQYNGNVYICTANHTSGIYLEDNIDCWKLLGGGGGVAQLKKLEGTAIIQANDSVFLHLTTGFDKYDIRSLYAKSLEGSDIRIEIYDKASLGFMEYESLEQSEIRDIALVPVEDMDATKCIHIMIHNLSSTVTNVNYRVSVTSLS